MMVNGEIGLYKMVTTWWKCVMKI